MDSMRRNAQKMMPHIMALNKKPDTGLKNNNQPARGVSNVTAFAKGGPIKKADGGKMKDPYGSDRTQGLGPMSDKEAKDASKEIQKRFPPKTPDKSAAQDKAKDKEPKYAKGGEVKDKKQDRALMERHNKLMHPGQKSKLMNGGMVKKYADGGKTNPGEIDAFEGMSPVPGVGDTDAYYSGKLAGRNRQAKAKKDNALSAYANRGKDYIKDKLDDADVAISKNIGLKERAKRKESFRTGLKEEGYKKGGKVKGDKKKVMGTVGEANALMSALKKVRRPATPMPGTRMAGLGMAPPMAPQMAPPMKHGGKVMKKAAGGAAKLRKKSPMPDKIKMMLYGKGG